MKKLMAVAACAVFAAGALCACDSRDGRINDRKETVSVVVSERVDSRMDSSRVQSRTSGTHSGEGVLHDTASMIGEVGEDIADGAENIGDSVKSDVKDITDGRDSTDVNDNM